MTAHPSSPSCDCHDAAAQAIESLSQHVSAIGPPGWPSAPTVADPSCPMIDWARSGAMWLTGCPHEAPMVSGAAVMSAVRAGCRVFEALAGPVRAVKAPAPSLLLAGRAALTAGTRQGRISVGGSCRMVRTRDGWAAINLARNDDRIHLAAVLGGDWPGDPWKALETSAATLSAAALVGDARLVGVPAAVVPPPSHAVTARPEPWGLIRHGDGRPRHRPPLVVDLSSLWAGPVCARMLASVGMRVIKVESSRRPDGARRGNSHFYDWLHHGHESVALDFATGSGQQALRDLVASADVVIEGSRPRALRQLGIDAPTVAEAGATWISITGYGRSDDVADRVAFGDDAAVAGGLNGWDAKGDPVFCADAIADPLTGLHAAVAGLASVLAGGGHLIDLAMSGVAAFSIAHPGRGAAEVVSDSAGGWILHHGGLSQPVLRPTPPPQGPSAPPLGRHTANLFPGMVDGRARGC